MSISKKNHSKDTVQELWRDHEIDLNEKQKKTYLDAFDKYDSVAIHFNDQRLGVKKNELWGAIDENGKEIINCQFRDNPIFINGFARVNYGRHKYGLIDVNGNFSIPAEYDNVKGFDEEGFAQFEKGIYWGTIDKDGNKHILPRKKFQQIGSFLNGIAPAKIETKWGLINTKGEHITKFEYYEINRHQDIYYTRPKPRKYGYLNQDGTPLFSVWFDHIEEFDENGFAVAQLNSKYGLAHRSGIMLHPMIYNHIEWGRNRDVIIADDGVGVYILTTEGAHYLLDNNNEVIIPENNIAPTPQIIRSNNPEEPQPSEHSDVEIENIVNWILPGLTLFYRDTNIPLLVNQLYQVGDIIRAGTFVDMTHRAQKPTKRLRYIIASSHAAPLCEIEEICERNPMISECRMWTMHYNSYFKVEDIYTVGDQTQVLLLHIPYKALDFFKNNVQFKISTNDFNLIESARASFDDKLKMEALTEWENEEWQNRTTWPIGYDDNLQPVSLDYAIPEDEGTIGFGNLIKKLSDDLDELNNPHFEEQTM